MTIQHIIQATEQVIDDKPKRPPANASPREVIAWALEDARRKGDTRLIELWQGQQVKLERGK